MMTNRMQSLATASVTSYEPMCSYLEGVEKGCSTIFAIQEHHVNVGRLGEFQDRVADLGFRGLWSPASTTSKGGTSGGAAILGPSSTTLTAPPGLESHIIWDARAVAAHCHWGVPGGIVVICAYLDTELGFEGENLAII